MAYDGAELAPDGPGVYPATDAGAEFLQRSYMDLSNRQVTPLTADIPWNVEAFDVSPDGRTVAFSTNEEGR